MGTGPGYADSTAKKGTASCLRRLFFSRTPKASTFRSSMPPRARPNKKERALAFVNLGNAYHAFDTSATINLSLFYSEELIGEKPDEMTCIFEKSSQCNEEKPNEGQKKVH